MCLAEALRETKWGQKKNVFEHVLLTDIWLFKPNMTWIQRKRKLKVYFYCVRYITLSSYSISLSSSSSVCSYKSGNIFSRNSSGTRMNPSLSGSSHQLYGSCFLCLSFYCFIYYLLFCYSLCFQLKSFKLFNFFLIHLLIHLLTHLKHQKSRHVTNSI